jgi:hypothetical protein
LILSGAFDPRPKGWGLTPSKYQDLTGRHSFPPIAG